MIFSQPWFDLISNVLQDENVQVQDQFSCCESTKNYEEKSGNIPSVAISEICMNIARDLGKHSDKVL